MFIVIFLEEKETALVYRAKKKSLSEEVWFETVTTARHFCHRDTKK